MSGITIFLRVTIPAALIVSLGTSSGRRAADKPTGLLSNPQELRAKGGTLSITLRAALRSDGKNSFFFNGQPNAPTLRLSPGDRLEITYIDDLPKKPKESCAITPCMDMTNLHFHGLSVSPDSPQDDVLSMMANQGNVGFSLPPPES